MTISVTGNSSYDIMLLFTEVLIFNMCYITYVVIDINIHGNRYVEMSNYMGDKYVFRFLQGIVLGTYLCRSK